VNTYKALVKITETVNKTSYVVVQASDVDKAKLQLEAMYGRKNVLSDPSLYIQSANMKALD
jgi:hypothetical protein